MPRDPGAAVAWWRELQPNRPDGARNPSGNRATLASLRRADLVGAMSEPATFALFRVLGCEHQRDLPEVALCAAVLASVREDRPGHPARALGAGGEGVMSPLRFRRLMEASEPADRLAPLRRAVALAGRSLNVRGLAHACLHWTDKTRLDWTFNYYNAGDAAPQSVEKETIA